jgi:two-component system response regulator ChvI
VPSIAIVDDDTQIVALIEEMLDGEGYDVVSYRDSQTALHQIKAKAPDLVILDVIMPKMNGIELLQRLRQKSDIPVILLTERTEETEELLGLQAGADDYIHKPFSQRTLIERVKSVLRRARPAPEREAATGVIERGHLRLDKERFTCTWKGRNIVLTLTEFRLLEVLVARVGVVQTRDALQAHAYEDRVYVDERTIDSHMKRLRKKFREVDAEFEGIETLYGVGYRFRE